MLNYNFDFLSIAEGILASPWRETVRESARTLPTAGGPGGPPAREGIGFLATPRLAIGKGFSSQKAKKGKPLHIQEPYLPVARWEIGCNPAPARALRLPLDKEIVLARLSSGGPKTGKGPQGPWTSLVLVFDKVYLLGPSAFNPILQYVVVHERK